MRMDSTARAHEPGEGDESDFHNSDDSMTSSSEDFGARRDRAAEESAESSERATASSLSDATDDTDDTDDNDATDTANSSDSEDDEGACAEDMSFADRVARENRRSRRHQLLHAAREQPRRTPKDNADGNGREHSKASKKSFSREHKHRPVEMSSKKRVSVLRDATLGLGDGSGLMKKRRVRDPRFDSLGGNYSEKAFKKRYSFIFDEKLPEERRELKESLSKIKSERKREHLQRKLQKLTQQIKTEENRRKQEARRDKVLQRHKEATRGQANKFHLKKSDLKKQELVLKYQELQASGGLERYMEKRRKRNAAKDHRYMPEKR